MFIRKGLVLLACLGLLAACSSSQSGADTSDVASGLTRAEAQAEWVTRLGSLWAHLSNLDEPGGEDGYWLPTTNFSDLLVENQYFSQTKESWNIQRFSRNFCGAVGYDELIAKHIGGDVDGVRWASSYGMGMDATDFSADSTYVEIMMTVFRLNRNVEWDAVGKNLHQDMQDRIAAKSSGPCSFNMRQFLRKGAKYSETQSLRGWWTEKDILCSKQPCLGLETRKFQSLLSEYRYESPGEPAHFYLVQTNFTGRPFMRSVFFMPKPEQGTLMLLELVSLRNGYKEGQMSEALAEKHAKLAKDLNTAWELRSAKFYKREELLSLYSNAKPLSETVAAEVEIAINDCLVLDAECVRP